MNPQEIRDFLKSIKHTDIEEMQYQSEGNSIYFRKTDVKPMVHVKNNAVEDKNKKEEKQTVVAIKSSMVGTFANSQINCETPFVKEGDMVVVGQKIGQIEAMKIIKDIFSDIKGKVVKVLISDGQPVEYGQKLFLVDTSKE
ncbi:MAG: biotin/lipoyl-binding protein [Endomicrobium sp.]|jgi:biotin carboxyl carrier protein|nr:biotin/lipoyl-binding protein [Endomicrobium sp.]